MRAVAPPVVYGSRFAALRRSFGRHKWRPYVCGRLNVVFRGCFVASPVGAPFMTPGAGTAHVVGRVACRQMRAGRRLVCRFVAAGLRHRVGHPGVTSGAPTFAAVECCFAAAIRASQVAPLRLRVVECCFASVIRASRVAPLRLRAVECCFASVIRASRVAPLRLRAVECGFASVIRASQVAPLRLRVVECCFVAVIRASRVAPLRLRVVVGGVTRGCRRKGMGMKKEAGLTLLCLSGFLWLRRLDSNERPPGYEPGELPTAPLRDVFLNSSAKVRLLEISSKFFADFFPFFEKCGVCGAVAGLSVWGR